MNNQYFKVIVPKLLRAPTYFIHSLLKKIIKHLKFTNKFRSFLFYYFENSKILFMINFLSCTENHSMLLEIQSKIIRLTLILEFEVTY